MPQRTVRPLSDFVDPQDTPIYDLLSLEEGDLNAASGFEVVDARTEYAEGRFSLEATFYWNADLWLQLPGADGFRFGLDGTKPMNGLLVCGERPSLDLTGIGLELEFGKKLLADAKTGEAAKIVANGANLRADETGWRLGGFSGASLAWAKIAGTPLEIELSGVSAPGFTGESTCTLLSIDSAKLRLPAGINAAGTTDRLTFEGKDLKIGRRGLSGRFSKRGGVPLAISFLGLPCEIRAAEFVLDEGDLAEARLDATLDLSSLNVGASVKVEAEVRFGASGITAALAAGSEVDGNRPLLLLEIRDLLRIGVRTLRLEAEDEKAVLWLSGTLTPLFASGWPDFEFDEIGLSSDGSLRLRAGTSVATPDPFTIEWNGAQLTVTAFQLQRPVDAGDDLELRISAGVSLAAFVPAGFSVDGLVARWNRATDSVGVRFDGIGIEFGVPGAFAVGVEIAFNADEGLFRGAGYVDIEAAELRLSALCESHRQKDEDGTEYNALLIAAETTLVPGGIPLGATGLSLYAVSGLLAVNREMAVEGEHPRRYFDLFVKSGGENKPGLADPKKWRPKRDCWALGLGVVVGTSDDGWSMSFRGSLVLNLPDLTLLVAAELSLMKERASVESRPDGALTATLAIRPAERSMHLDFTADWTYSPFYAVNGSGGGEFRFDDPLAWKVWIGLPPGEGAPVRASYMQIGSGWLATGDFWFGIDAAKRARIGALIGIEWRVGGGGLYVELVASARGQFAISWNPAQFDGNLKLYGRAVLSGCGVSLGISVTADPFRISMSHPLSLAIDLSACISFRIFTKKIEICLAYRFAWERRDRPPLGGPGTRVAFVPRAWTPVEKPGGGMDDGVASFEAKSDDDRRNIGTVHPHSVLSLEFPKSVYVRLDALPDFAFNDQEHRISKETLGENSPFQVARTLTQVEVLELSNDSQARKIFGTFLRSSTARTDENGTPVDPRLPNTLLRLGSSQRFEDSGSHGGGGAELSPSPCQPSPPKRMCIDLAGLRIGGTGALSNGWRYRWTLGPPLVPGIRTNVGGVGLDCRDRFALEIPASIGEVTATLARMHSGGSSPDLEEVWRPKQGSAFEFRGDGETPFILRRLCWSVPGAPVGGGGGWSGSTGSEEWTRPAESWLYKPDDRYRISVSTLAELFEGAASAETAAKTLHYDFVAGPPPLRKDSLLRAVLGVYPSDGARPTYLGYDLAVRFDDTYYPALYGLAGRFLGVRILDLSGKPILSSSGRSVLVPPAWRNARTRNGTPTEHWWQADRLLDPDDPCQGGAHLPPERPVILPIAFSDLKLAPRTAYTAQILAPLASSPEETSALEVLYGWSFVTSAYRRFSDLAAPPAKVPKRELVQYGPEVEFRFDPLVRSFGVPTVAVAESTRMTPVRRGRAIAYVLIESPEPLNDAYERLSIEIQGEACVFAANADSTRLVARLSDPHSLAGNPVPLTVVLRWQGALADAPEEGQRKVNGVAETEVATWTLPLEGLP